MASIRMTFVDDEDGQWYLIPLVKLNRFLSHGNRALREDEFGACKVWSPADFSFTDPKTVDLE